MVEKIFWYNKKIYDPEIISTRMKFVENNMNGLLPVSGKEKEKLENYAREHDLPNYEILCLRNIIKIQKEINASKFFYSISDKIRNRFSREINEITDDNKLIFFLKSTKMPLSHLFRLLEPTDDFKKLTKNNLRMLDKLKNKIISNEREIRDRSIQFEHSLEKYLMTLNLNFRTENEIKAIGDYSVTPDVLFDKPVILEVNGIEYEIKWMDAKNYMLVNVPFIMKSLEKQSNKYYDIFGLGAFVFHYGFDKSVMVSNAIILDGSFLE